MGHKTAQQHGPTWVWPYVAPGGLACGTRGAGSNCAPRPLTELAFLHKPPTTPSFNVSRRDLWKRYQPSSSTSSWSASHPKGQLVPRTERRPLCSHGQGTPSTPASGSRAGNSSAHCSLRRYQSPELYLFCKTNLRRPPSPLICTHFITYFLDQQTLDCSWKHSVLSKENKKLHCAKWARTADLFF